jgi:hypothetical protein
MAGCTGKLNTFAHGVSGVDVLAGCTFRVTGWAYDAKGPLAEWRATPVNRADPTTFDYFNKAAKMIAQIGDEDGNNVGGARRAAQPAGRSAVCALSTAKLLARHDRAAQGLTCSFFALDLAVHDGVSCVGLLHSCAVPPRVAPALLHESTHAHAGPAAGGAADIMVRLGLLDGGQRDMLSPTLKHILVWCAEFDVDFGSAMRLATTLLLSGVRCCSSMFAHSGWHGAACICMLTTHAQRQQCQKHVLQYLDCDDDERRIVQ